MGAHGQRGSASGSTPAAPIDEEKDANRHPHKEKLPGKQGSDGTPSEYAKDQTEAEECREEAKEQRFQHGDDAPE